jgi:plasmid stabilization system protein ParE
MGWRVALTDEADTDLENVVAFLAKKSPTVAMAIGLELLQLIFSLDQFPERGAPVRNRPKLRKLAHRHYLIYYRVNDPASIVEIIRIWDCRQDPARLKLA